MDRRDQWIGWGAVLRYGSVAAGIAAAVAVLWIGPAYACGPSPWIASTPERAAGDSVVEIVGAGFTGEVPLTLHWASEGGPVLAEAVTSDAGQFVVEVTIPVVAPGTYAIFAVQELEGHTMSAARQLDVFDGTPPEWPGGAALAAPAVDHATVTLAWPEATDTVGVAGYRVFRDGVEVADGPDTTAEVAGLSPATAYTFAVEAYDAADNLTEDRLSATVTTPPVTTPPVTTPPADGPSPVESDATACSPAAAASVFTDIAGNAHRDAIDCAASYGIAQGTSATTYSPGLSVRRDQMASFIARLLTEAGVELPAPASQRFTDIAGNSHAEAINQLAELGVVQGITAATYGPAQEVRRDQMASFLVRAYEQVGEPLPGGSAPFTDVDGNAHEGAIGKAHEAGFAHGVSASTYAPARPVRRDQMASFIVRTLDRFAAEGACCAAGSG